MKPIMILSAPKFMLMMRLKNDYLFLSLFFCALFLLPIQSRAKEAQVNPDADTLVVGVAGDQPFVMFNDSLTDPGGIAVDVWEDLAEEADWDYRYQPFSSVGKALRAVKKGKVDLIVGPLSITSKRLEDVAFSQPFFQSSLSIVSHKDDTLLGQVKALLSFKLFFAVIGFLLILAIVGTLFWLAERKVNPEEFSAKPSKGIGNGMWLAIVTMSTVGYGDMAPRTAIGRIIAGTWIVLAIIFATSMVAGIASVLTSAGTGSVITNVEDLPGKKVATLKDAPAADFIVKHKAKLVGTNTIDEAMNLLNNDKIDAVVFDRPQLRYYINNHPGEDLYIPHAEYNKQGYGFAFPKGSDLVMKVNLRLLNLSENQRIQKVVHRFLGREEG